MTSGPELTARTALPRRRQINRASVALAVLLVAFAVLATWGPFVLRGRAATACDMVERVGGSLLMASGVLLFGVNLAVAWGLWALFRHQGSLGVTGALFAGFVIFAVVSTAYLSLTAAPTGHPTPPSSCPGGHPPWWPAVLPG